VLINAKYLQSDRRGGLFRVRPAVEAYTHYEKTGAAMTADAHATGGVTDEGRCWCCGRVTAGDALVRLGNHPEVGICVNCAHFLRRRARDLQATAMRQRLRGAAESARREVMARGWHNRPVIGPALRWINQHLPW
jgi:hypothetical protein